MLCVIMRTGWNILTTHGQVLLALAHQPDLRVRDIAARVGLTERAVQQIVGDLVEAGYLERIKEGRRNRYLVRGDRPLPALVGRTRDVSELLAVLVREPHASPSMLGCRALVLACSDYRYQEPLRVLLAAEGLLGRAETMLLPGGASALAGSDGGRIMAALEFMCHLLSPERLLLLAHHGCAVPGAFVAHRSDPFIAQSVVSDRRRRTFELVCRRLGLVPEMWFLDERGAKPVTVPRAGRHAGRSRLRPVTRVEAS
jgi:DNA-binding Lrp family transcriptional regulator